METGNGKRALSRRRARLAFVLLLAAGTVAIAPGAVAEGKDPKAILKAMSTYVSSQKTIEFTIDSDIEVITPQLEKLQFCSSGEVLVSRPDKIRAHRASGHTDAAMVFDGKTVSVVSRKLDGYAQFEAPGTIDQLFGLLRAGYGIALPAADLLQTNSYDLLVAGVLEARYIGQGVVDGVTCEHLAFRNVDTDWQLWVEAGEKPVPRKIVITSKTMNAAPQYTVRVKSWKTGFTPAPGAFTFVPPPGAKKLDPQALIDLDELPQETAVGGSHEARHSPRHRRSRPRGRAARGPSPTRAPAETYAGVARRSTVGVGAPGPGVAPGVGAPGPGVAPGVGGTWPRRRPGVGAPGPGVAPGVGAPGPGVAPANRGGPVNRVGVR